MIADDNSEIKHLCVYCFDVLVAHLHEQKLKVKFPKFYKGVNIA